MLSKSVGDLSTSDLIGLSLKSQTASSITYSGYVLKRSNNPWTDTEVSNQTQQTSSTNDNALNTLASMSKNRSTARLDLYDSIRNKQPSTSLQGLNAHKNIRDDDGDSSATHSANTGGSLLASQLSSFKPSTLTSSLLPPQSSMSTPKNSNVTEDYCNQSVNSNLTKIPNLNENSKSIPVLAPRSSKSFKADDTMEENSNNNSASLGASILRNEESSSLSSKGKEGTNQYDGHYSGEYSYEEEEYEGYQSASIQSQSSSSYLNFGLNQPASSDSSHIPHIPRSKTQPIAIARTTSEDSEECYTYNHLHPQNYNTSSRQRSFQPFTNRDTMIGSSMLLAPSDAKIGSKNIPRPLAYVRMTSAPAESAVKSYPPPPSDYIDSKDGHIWRAKYCILEDGILYFYPNAETGNSVGAELERSRMAAKNSNDYADSHDQYDSHYDTGCENDYNNGHAACNIASMASGDFDDEESDHLAKSPMPRKSMRMNHLNSNSSNGLNGKDSFCHDPNVYWEKRVALDKVGNVRSNPDYGERVFELLAINSDEERDRNNGEQVDRLLLRAGSEHEMNCWIFEIHRSFIFLMKQFAELVGSSYRSTGGYLDGSRSRFPSKKIGSRHSLERINSSPLSSSVLISTSLSHGHGRSLRRRRTEVDSSIGVDAIQTPQSPNTSQTVTDEGILHRIRSQSHETFKDFNKGGPPETLEIKITDSDFGSETRMSSSRLTDMLETSMSIASPRYVESHGNNSSNLNNQPKSTNKYIPPQKRNNYESNFNSEAFSEQVKLEEEEFLRSSSSTREKVFHISPAESFEESEVVNVSLGGCADPSLINGTICDEAFIPEKASKVKQSAKKPFGYNVGQSDIGATSTCGVRDSNEDSYLVVNDLIGDTSTVEEDSFFGNFSKRSLFAIFDGHCGNHAARYSAEMLRGILLEESRNVAHLKSDIPIESILQSTISRLDEDFCELCSSGERDWFSGTTAIIALVLDENLIIANVGDCRGILCCSTNESQMEGWEILESDDSQNCTNENVESIDNPMATELSEIFWREVAKTHSPSHEEEKSRIESANGWTNNSEQEVTIASQFQTIKEHLSDEDVRLMFLRWFSDRSDSKHARILNIWRVCGDLAVSRAIGDREYKAAYGEGSLDNWTSTAPFLYPSNHSGFFNGDLIVSTPDINHYEVSGEENVLLLACDGLWDVLDADDAVRLTRKLVFDRGLTARESAQRLAELAGHLGSSDNITLLTQDWQPNPYLE